ncbi:right-handed parallel beta-helix repeat-containing protein [Tahibacter amnicola]|uniref:Right-handed parallel beta-helix repeat-containing protein n=1 Tax=Tahibacter amnicola TaxID=2976241 RepID=A0ABY6BJ88_9GAMM|nr:right-handed parallel beta-helix repeat-containing protein [Tahibacter amnicola]UXI69827.1 right-handed parallel beta-helix repeat-containing protein [Tahibacter amnicola]
MKAYVLRLSAILMAAVSVPAIAQNSATLAGVEGYGNLVTGGAIATLTGDADRDARVTLEWRRAGEPAFRGAHPLVRIDATHLAGSLFHLSPGTAYEIRLTLTDPDGTTGATSQVTTLSTRPDTLPEAGLRTVYVTPTGNDANNGLSPQAAVQTISRGVAIAQAGDTVLVAPGIYRESVSMPRSGTATQPIILRGQGPGVVLDGAQVVGPDNAWTSVGSGVYRRSHATATGHVVSDQGRLFRYTSLAQLQALAAGAPGGFWHDGTQLHVKLPGNASPSPRTFHVARLEDGIVVDGRSFIRIENLEIRHFGAGDYGKGIYLRQANDVIVRANTIHDIGSAGIWVKGGSRHRIEDNTLYDTSIPGWPWPVTKGSSSENNGIAFTDNVGRGHVVRHNQFSGWFNGIGPCGSAAPPSGVTTEVDIYRNTFRHHNDDALEPEGYCANIRLFENTIADSHMAFAVAPAAPGPTFILRNVAFDIGSTRSSQIDGHTSSVLKINSGFSTPVGPVLLYHNTFVTAAPSTDAMSLLTPGFSTYIRSRNNIYAGTRNVLDKVNSVTLDFNYDLLYTTDSTRFVRWMGTNYTSFSAFGGAATGQETSGINAPPGLVSAGERDFRLGPGSAAIDRGERLPGINDEFAGTAPDMGADEFADRLFANGFEMAP